MHIHDMLIYAKKLLPDYHSMNDQIVCNRFQRSIGSHRENNIILKRNGTSVFLFLFNTACKDGMGNNYHI